MAKSSVPCLTSIRFGFISYVIDCQRRRIFLDIIAALIVFFISLLWAVSQGISILYPLLLGLACFIFVSWRRGYSLQNLWGMMLAGAKKSLVVIEIFVLIGAITAVWRACGTISFIVYYAIAFMSAKYFILSAFLLSCLVSFLLGTSFGTAGTIGIILIVLAKSGGVDINVAAGAIIAGAYFGDRCSPMSSSANLVAVITGTNLYSNIKNMLRTAALPFALSVIGYICLSYLHPLTFYNNQIENEILHAFDLHAVVLFPAVIILLLAVFRMDVKISMGISIASGILIGCIVQHIPLSRMLYYIAAGYTMGSDSFFARIIQGGGLYSMLQVALIVLISSTYAGIFAGTGLLKEIELVFEKLSQKAGVYAAAIFSSTIMAAFSCNQTLAVMLTHQFAYKSYETRNISKYKLAVDLENTVILISALIPWNIAGAFPAAALSADAGFIFYAFYLYLVPLTNLLPIKTGIKDN